MDYVDAIIAKLADPVSRATFFDSSALGQLAGAAYDASALNLTGPFSAVFDEVQVGVPAAGIARVEGSWTVAGSTQRTEAQFQVGGLSVVPTLRVDVLWRGVIMARMTSADAPVTSVDADWPALGGIDEEIVTALGALPTDPVALEAERRRRIRARIAGAFDQPNLVTGERVDQWLRDMGAASASDFVTNPRSAWATHTKLVFAAPSAALSALQPLPVTIAFLVRAAGFSLARLLWESRLVRERLEATGAQRPRNGPRQRTPIVVGWIVPATTFDDNDWPGASGGMTAAQARAARQAVAVGWLAGQGIGLVTT